MTNKCRDEVWQSNDKVNDILKDYSKPWQTVGR